MFFSDEANFYLDGAVTVHNAVVWGIKHPSEHFKEKSLNSPKVTVWAAMSSEYLVALLDHIFFMKDKTLMVQIFAIYCIASSTPLVILFQFKISGKMERLHTLPPPQEICFILFFLVMLLESSWTFHILHVPKI